MKILFEFIKSSCQKFEKKYPLLAPVSYMILSQFFFSIVTLYVKTLKRISTPQVLFTRSILALCYIRYIVEGYSFEPYPQKSTLKKLLVRGLFGSVTAVIWFSAIKLIPLSEATVLQKTSPLWTSFAAVFIIKTEKYSFRLFFFIFTGMIGILLIFRPPFILAILNIPVEERLQEDALLHAIGAGMSLLCAFLVTFVQLLIANLAKEVSNLILFILKTNQFVIFTYFSFFLTLVPALMCITIPQFQPTFPTLAETIQLFQISIFGTLGQILINRSFFFGNISIISLAGQIEIIFSFIWDMIYFQQIPDALSVIGIIILMGSLCLAIIKKK